MENQLGKDMSLRAEACFYAHVQKKSLEDVKSARVSHLHSVTECILYYGNSMQGAFCTTVICAFLYYICKG